MGVFIGPIFGIVHPSEFENISEIFASIALMIILFDGGLNLKLSKVLEEAASSTILALVSFFLTLMAVGITAGYIIFENWLVGFMFGAVVAGTSGAIVIPIILKMKNVNECTKIRMSIETTVTDVLCIVVAIAIANYLVPQGDGGTNAAKSIVNAFSSGILIGLFGGIIWLKIMKVTKPLQYSFMLTFAFVFTIFAITEVVGGSGPVAALIIGLVLSNGEEIGRMFRYKQKTILDKSMKDFHAEISFFVKSFFFVYTGLIISIKSIDVVFYGLLITGIIFGVRHVSIKFTMKHEKLEDRELMTLLIPRGLAAAVLATVPITYGFADKENGIISKDLVNTFVGITFIVIILTVLVTTAGIPLGQKRWTKENMDRIQAKKDEKKKQKKDKLLLKKGHKKEKPEPSSKKSDKNEKDVKEKDEKIKKKKTDIKSKSKPDEKKPIKSTVKKDKSVKKKVPITKSKTAETKSKIQDTKEVKEAKKPEIEKKVENVEVEKKASIKKEDINEKEKSQNDISNIKKIVDNDAKLMDKENKIEDNIKQNDIKNMQNDEEWWGHFEDDFGELEDSFKEIEDVMSGKKKNKSEKK